MICGNSKKIGDISESAGADVFPAAAICSRSECPVVHRARHVQKIHAITITMLVGW